MKKNYFKNLKDVLSQRQLSKVEFSKMMGVTDITVYRWCNGTIVPTYDKLKKMCDKLGVSASEVLGF